MGAAVDPLDPASLRGWTPVRIRSAAGPPTVDWALFGERFSDPFFEQTAERVMRHPFNQVFARSSRMAAVEALHASRGGLEPAALIFHMSRCGSTLVSQMLAADPANLVLSEAQPLDAVLRLRAAKTFDDATIVRWLRATLNALARPSAGERRLFVKFHAWHVLELPLIVRAFPAVPWLFLFREPRAVLRSQSASPGAEAFAGGIDPAYLGIDQRAADALPPDEYAARAVAAFCNAALRHAAVGRSRFVDYAALPEVVFTDLLGFFGIAAGDAGVGGMRRAAARDTKRDGAFRPRETPHAMPAIDRLAARWLEPAYAALRARCVS